ncbi:unnamed protein product [Pelagomonas calceolata]|uniref:Pre-mRNA polyadenylation factor Fip1 domain-containing protein n=1 Tax=Pelagomonas calceolata TaxID=35677 RepID=A0A8J2SHE0_9STRA|nr:unnamed protein product [Pelagomonas calceolata]
MSAAAVAAPPPEPEADAEAPKKRGPPVVIIDSGNTNVAGGISGRALASRVKTFQDGSNVWVREKTEETDAPEVVEARREALRAKAVIGDGEGVELDAEKAKQEALGGVSEETMDKTAREIQCFRLAAFDVNIDELEVKEWLRPDADPSDYFNYGMGEDTWRQYRDQQLILRRSLQERRAAMAQAAARERHAELLKQGPPQPPTLPMPIMGGPRPPWGGPGGPMPPPNAFPPRGFPGFFLRENQNFASRRWRGGAGAFSAPSNRRGRGDDVASMAWTLRAIEPTRSRGRRRVDGLTARRRRPGLPTSRLPAELSSSKFTVAAGRACISSSAELSSARRFPRRSVRRAGGARAGARAFSKTVAVARAVPAATAAGGLS